MCVGGGRGNRLMCFDLMAHQTNSIPSLQTSHASQAKTPTPCPILASIKIKNLLQSYILQRVRHVVRAFSHAKSMLLEALEKKTCHEATPYKLDKSTTTSINRMRKNKKKRLFSFIMTRHVIPMPELIPSAQTGSSIRMHLDSSHCEGDQGMESHLSGYLHWLEENPEELEADGDYSEIDMLAEKFIARGHERFRLEKVESYRRYQDMLARSI